ncbi:endonuclease Q family protein [Syntrophomonas erecta]
MRNVFADLHIHIGSAQGKPVKITASRRLTLEQIIFTDAPYKGLDLVGIADAGTVNVLMELEEMLADGRLRENGQGGFIASNGVGVITACEVESQEGVHFLIYLPGLNSLKTFQNYMRSRVKNLSLSTQRAKATARELINLAHLLDGIFCPAHAFTPHKGAYGMWTDSFGAALGKDVALVKGLELGLSADTDMADMISETRTFTFLSNSDAHSSPKIGREYNLLRLAECSFQEFRYALEEHGGRRVMANFGMDPLLGKYHRSYCPHCSLIATLDPPVIRCQQCGSDQIVMGVYDRIMQIRDQTIPSHPIGRPPYHYRVPLLSLPGIGPRTADRLVKYFGSEISVLERASGDDIVRLAGEPVAELILKMRLGRLKITPGGGGFYGKVQKNSSNH